MLRPSIYPEGFVENLFDDFFREPFFNTGKIRTVEKMNTDIKEYNDRYEIEMDLPGFAKEDVQAELKNGYLTIRAGRTASNDEKAQDHRYIRKERYTGHYQRSFYVGDAITQEDIKAKFKNGTLTLEVNKKDEPKQLPDKKYIDIE